MSDADWRLTISAHALADLAALYDHIAAEDPAAAERLLDQMIAKMDWMPKAKFRGVSRDWISPGLRALPFKGRCIYFRIVGTEIRVIRVLHGRQDISQPLFPNDD